MIQRPVHASVDQGLTLAQSKRYVRQKGYASVEVDQAVKMKLQGRFASQRTVHVRVDLGLTLAQPKKSVR